MHHALHVLDTPGGNDDGGSSYSHVGSDDDRGYVVGDWSW